MPSFNKVILAGHLTRDPEEREAGNSTVCEFGLAVNRKWKNRDGQQQEDVCFVDCNAWARTGEAIQKYFGKGKPILVEGRLQLDQWQDKQTGANRSKIKVVVESFSFLGDGGEQRQDKPQRADDGPEPISDDELPF